MRLVSKALRILVLLLILPLLQWDAWRYQRKPMPLRQARIRMWSSLGLKLLGKKVIVVGQHHGNDLTNTLIVSNHQGVLDPLPLLCAIDSPLSFVSKIENRRILGIGAWGDAIDLIYFDRSSQQGNIAMLRECAKVLKNGSNVLIFPEGTRSLGNHMNPFKANAFGLVKLAHANILPVSISHGYDTFDSSQPITITIHPLIPYAMIKDMDVETVSSTLYDIIEHGITST